MRYKPASSSVSHIGHVRKHNEDAFLAKPDLGLWVVADGMGGHEAGDLASNLIVESLARLGEDMSVEEVKLTIHSVNTQLIALGEKYNRINGSTVVLLSMINDQCEYIWAGDSRLYLLRNNELIQLTRDHSQAEVYVDLGILSREEASQHSSANLLTRCIGTDEDLSLDTGNCEIEASDRFLLSSDGLDKHVSHQKIEQVLLQHDRDEALKTLLSLTLDAGGTDNVTVTIVDIMSE